MPNIRYANMCHWKSIPYRQIDNFREFYQEDRTNSAYYSDWDNILKYQSALGFGGIEIAHLDRRANDRAHNLQWLLPLVAHNLHAVHLQARAHAIEHGLSSVAPDPFAFFD